MEITIFARSPSLGLHRNLDGRDYYLIVRNGNALAETPTISAVYSFDDNTVVIYGIKAWEAKPDE
jgi:hypothetical protein